MAFMFGKRFGDFHIARAASVPHKTPKAGTIERFLLLG
jgi:hypothetical protein